jgi:hypothetical protein
LNNIKNEYSNFDIYKLLKELYKKDNSYATKLEMIMDIFNFEYNFNMDILKNINNYNDKNKILELFYLPINSIPNINKLLK